MLTKNDENLINKNCHHFYQLVGYNSHVFGEPYLFDGYLYYFDGEVATLITHKAEGLVTEESLNKAIAHIAAKHNPENLMIWGELPELKVKPLKGYKKKERKINPIYKEMVFKTADFKPTKKYRQLLRRAESEGITIKKVEVNYYKHEYTKLLAETHKSMLGPKSLSYYAIYPYKKETKFWEVIKGGKLVAVQLVVEMLPSYMCLAEIGYDKTTPKITGITDALLIDFYKNKVKYISYGGCANEGIFNHKQELIGKIPIGFYENYLWCEFYKRQEAEWWLFRMKKTSSKN